VSDTMALISSKLSNIVPFSCCALFLYNEEAETLGCRFATGVESEIVQQLTIRSGQGLNGWVARNRRPLVNARPSADFEAAGRIADQTALLSALVCPLVFNERLIGTIAVYHTDLAVYTDDHRRLLDRISEQAAAVIYNSIVFEQTQEDSLTDPLTGLPNTRFMFMHLTRELARADRLKTEVSLLVMDLDHFKTINDTFGHGKGDDVLAAVGAVAASTVRASDFVGRFGGEEFAVVLPDTDRTGGLEAAEKLRAAIADISIPGLDRRITASFGVAVLPDDAGEPELLLRAADRALYAAKGAGRDRVETIHDAHPSTRPTN
jgi:diguanylate cyclase (GGDEF)-like protein